MKEQEYFRLVKEPKRWRLMINQRELTVRDNHRLMRLLRLIIYTKKQGKT